MSSSERVELLAELLERCRSNDPSARARLVQRFYSYARTLAETLANDRNEAEDVVQSSMLIVLLRLADLRDPEAFPGWLRQIIRSQASRTHRKKHATDLTIDLPDDRPSPIDRAQLQELRQQVHDALASLPPIGQEAVRMFYLDELDQREIADQLDVPLGTVKRRLHDARAKLRILLSEDESRGRDLPL